MRNECTNECTHARTHERINQSVVSARVRSSLYPFRRTRRSVARVAPSRNAVASSRSTTFDSSRFKRGSDARRARNERLGPARGRGRRFFSFSVGVAPAGGCARAGVFFAWVCVRLVLGVCVFSLFASNASRERGKDGWMVRTERVRT